MARVFLRPLENNDINENYLSWFRDEKVTKFLDVDGNTLTKEIVEEYIKFGLNSQTYYLFAICLFDSKKHIGNLKIGPINHFHSLSDLVTVIGNRSQWKKGLATEAIGLGIKLAFEKYNIRKLSAGIYSKNISSTKAYVNAGFFVEGTLKDHFLIDEKYQDKIIVSCFNPNFLKR